ncbi:hypothetical protein TWF730_008798 [Orbilia blumenaviensis]|uniref:Fido domain-containing protein n=1 Tax=Orbilia blumenaviensis TaxID=1796055 RepID=A0AAV9V9Y2_9PEZI
MLDADKIPLAASLRRWGLRDASFQYTTTREFGRMIYASNALEDTGLGLEDTIRLCKLVFTDDQVPETYKQEKRLEAQRQRMEEEARWMITKWASAAKQYFIGDRSLFPAKVEEEEVEEFDERRKDKQARREVIQHARAWKYFLERFCIDREELNINLLRNTHSVLCAGYQPDDNSDTRKDWWVWSGVFRDFNTVGAETLQVQEGKRRDEDGSKTPTQRNYERTEEGRRPLNYIRSSAVESYVESMIEDFRVLKNAAAGSRDATMGYCSLAAWVEGMIMNVWPFKEENGKLARLVMNGVLWRYCGVVVGIGVEEGDKEEYLGIVKRAGDIFHEEEYQTAAEEQKGHEELAGVIRRKVEEGRLRTEQPTVWAQAWNWLPTR